MPLIAALPGVLDPGRIQDSSPACLPLAEPRRAPERVHSAGFPAQRGSEIPFARRAPRNTLEGFKLEKTNPQKTCGTPCTSCRHAAVPACFYLPPHKDGQFRVAISPALRRRRPAPPCTEAHRLIRRDCPRHLGSAREERRAEQKCVVEE